jgi:hypothetical protein
MLNFMSLYIKVIGQLLPEVPTDLYREKDPENTLYFHIFTRSAQALKMCLRIHIPITFESLG